jgi:Ca2+-binding RTX toxin-like protein
MSTIASVLAGRVFSAPNIIRAITSLYSNVGANRDERNWSAILASADPLAASEIALSEMYQNSSYLLRNANNLLTLNYTQNQIVYTYHELSQRLGFTYRSDWAAGSVFADAANLSFNNVRSFAISDQQNSGPTPILTLTNDATGFLARADLAGQLRFIDGTFIANLTAGIDERLAVLGALKSGQVVAVSTNNRQSTASTQTVTLGTAGNDTYDASGAGAVVQYVFTGDGNDTITGGAGADIIFAGDGDDVIRGSQEDIRLSGGNGNDRLEISTNFTVNDVFQIRSIEEIRLMANGLTLNLTGMFFGETIRGFATGSSTVIGSNGPDVFIGGTGNDNFSGAGDNDTFTGGLGNDTFTGGLGNDTFNIDAGTDSITDLADSDVFVISAGATLNATVAQEYTATAASRNLGGAAANAVFTVSVNADFADFSLVTVANAATGGITINSERILGGGTITGSAGNDIITGGSLFNLAGETLIGGPGADTITGSVGPDQVTGGTGADIFRYAAGASGGTNGAAVADVITDFLAGTDKLQFTGVADVVSAEQAAVQAAVTALNGGAGATDAQIATAMALANTTDLGVAFAVYGGNTYVYFETTGANTNYVEATSVFIKLLGVIAAPTYAADVIA